MQLPDRSVRIKMLGLALPIKEEMLRSASSPTTLSAPSRPGHHQRGRSLNNIDVSQLSLSDPRSLAPVQNLSSKKEGKTGGFLKKVKSSNSLRSGEVESTASQAPRKQGHMRTSSATSIILKSFGRSSGKDVAGVVAAGGGASDGEDATWWAVRIRTTSCAALEVKEVGRLRGRLRGEAPR